MSAFRIGAHRGAMCHAPENTLAAFHLAAELGTCRIELDVRRTRDLVLVLLHDETVDRTTDGHGRLAEMDFATVRGLRSGAETLPTLSQALEFARGRVRLLVEVKDYDAVDDIVLAIRTAGMVEACTISCFDETVLARVKELTPALATAWFHVRPGPLNAEDLRDRLGVELLVVWPAAVDPPTLTAAKAAGFQVRCGFRDDLPFDQLAAEVRRVVGLGVDEVACGRPDWLARVRDTAAP